MATSKTHFADRESCKAGYGENVKSCRVYQLVLPNVFTGIAFGFSQPQRRS